MKKLSTLLLAVLLVLSQFTYSAIIYTDVSPDLVTVPSSTASFDVDMDNDMVPDFRFTCVDITGLRFIIAQAGQIGLSNFILEDTTGGTHNALAMASNTLIGPFSSIWHSMGSTNPTLFSDVFGTYSGLWLNSQDYYLGVQFKIGANSHYGWIRMNINQATAVVTLKDYAYDNGANNAIPAGAGAGAADVALGVSALDADDKSNGNDLFVGFSKAVNEATVDHYRIIVVKDAVASFDLVAAQAVPATGYLSVTPTGSSIATALPANLNDADGDPIAIGVMYRVYVLSKANLTMVSSDGLSLPSAPVQLITPADVTTSIICKDIANNGDSRDLEVFFARAAKESGILAYRIIVLKTWQAAGFGLFDAQVLPAGRFATALPTGGNIQITMAGNPKDSDGDDILENVPYKVIVMSIADSVMANLDSLSSPSDEFMLTNKPTGIDSQKDEALDFYTAGQIIFLNLPNSFTTGRFELFDLTGRMVYAQTIGKTAQALKVNDLQGVFVGRLTMEDQQVSKRLRLY